MAEKTFRIIRTQSRRYVLELTVEQVADRLDASLYEDGRSAATLDPQYLDDLVHGMAADQNELYQLLDELDNAGADIGDDELRVEEV